MHIVIDARIRRSSTGRYADRLIEHLQAIDSVNRYTILLQPDDPWQPKTKNFTRLSCPFKQFSFNPLDQIGFLGQLKKLKPDLVHFTMTQQPLFYFGRIVTTTHDLTMLKYVRAGKTPLPVFWLKRIGYRFLFWRGHKKSNRIIVPTDYVKDDLSNFQPFTRNKITVTHEASEPPLACAPVKPPGIKEPFIMYAGSAFPHKNLVGLVNAFSELSQNHPDLSLVLCGKKEHYYEQLEKYVATKPYADKIRITGFVSEAKLKWLYQNAAAYVFPSVSEGFGLPGLEAMAHGCPVASSNATCLPEVYGQAAHYFDPEDEADMAHKISDVLSDKDLRGDLVKAGSEQIKHYSWRKMAEQTLSVYESVLGGDS